jgi:hypothetical protein
MRAGEGTENWKMELLQEWRRESKNGSGATSEKQGRQTLNAKVKNRPFPACQIYRPRDVLPGAHTPRALTAGEMLTHWQAGPTTTTAAAQPHARHHHGAVIGGPRQAVTSACPLCPLSARPRRLKRRGRGA